MTGIVGPNGCGKSNVVDAIRWVLGETSAKALRGGEMADVIFNGTEKRKPLGMAEVTLTMADCEEPLKVDFNEVAITRRVFRDGKSRIPDQRHALPPQGHPRPAHGHRHRPHRLLDHGAGPDRPDPFLEAGRTPRGVRGGGRHHQVQAREEGGAAQARIHRGQPAARFRRARRAGAPDEFAQAPGRQGPPLPGAGRRRPRARHPPGPPADSSNSPPSAMS